MASAPDRVRLLVGGRLYEGWESVRIQRGIEQIAGGFDLALTERWPGQLTEWRVPPGEFCEVKIGDDVVITGFVDDVAVDFDASSHGISISGRDRTGDLVDCSAPSKSWAGQSFLQVAQALCKPFEVSVRDEVPGRVAGIRERAVTQPGESVFSILERFARQESVLLVSDGRGGLLLTRAGLAGRSSTVLQQGRNIERASGTQSHAELYSEIVIKSQMPGFAAEFSLNKAQPSGTVTRALAASRSSGVTRYRPLYLVAETYADAARCKQRAQWEASHREARAHRVSVTVSGWREQDGTLWRPNRLVRLVSEWLRTDADWLIAAVSYSLDERGSRTDLQLVHPDAFTELPEIPEPGEAAMATEFRLDAPKVKP